MVRHPKVSIKNLTFKGPTNSGRFFDPFFFIHLQLPKIT